MRNDKEIAKEALRRADNIHKRKIIRKRRIFGMCSVFVCLAIIISLSIALPILDNSNGTAGVYYASVFTSGAAGGYSLIGTIGFVLGAMTVILYKKNKVG